MFARLFADNEREEPTMTDHEPLPDDGRGNSEAAGLQNRVRLRAGADGQYQGNIGASERALSRDTSQQMIPRLTPN